MPSSNDHPEYDEKLLSVAPALTKTMVQSGYTMDLLEEPTPPKRDIESGTHRSPSRHTSMHTGARNTANGMQPKVASTSSLPKVAAKTPFYRTKRGVIVIIIVAIVILAAIIGGAVAGTVGKGSASSAAPGMVSNGSQDPHHPPASGDTGQGGAAVTDGSSTSQMPNTTTSTVILTRTLPITNPGVTSISGLVSGFA